MVDKLVVTVEIEPAGSGRIAAFRNREFLSEHSESGAWSFLDGDTVYFEARANPGWAFREWKGPMPYFSSNPTAAMRAYGGVSITVQAYFSAVPKPVPPAPSAPAPAPAAPAVPPSAAPGAAAPPAEEQPGILADIEQFFSSKFGTGGFQPDKAFIDGLSSVIQKAGIPESNLPRILGALNPVNSAAQFGEFIFEEAMQASSFGIGQLIREKEYDAAARLLPFQGTLLNAAIQFRNTFGAFNTITPEAFKLNIEAQRIQLDAFHEIIAKYQPLEFSPDKDFDCLAREIIDGDTFRGKVGALDVRVRLVGINTPESKEPFYSDSKKALFRKIWGEKVHVRINPTAPEDIFGRVLGIVEIQGRNVNLEMVREGWAFFYEREGHILVNPKLFGEADAFARRENRGIWGLIRKADLAAPQGAIPGPKIRTGIKITSIPSHAEITLDGEYTYKQTPETFDVEHGKHTVQIDAYGYESQFQEIEVPDGVVVEAHFKLEKL